jgi:uroporphyrin-3 C-methyltransferase
MEEAIARLAEQRLRGELLLKLNEAEFLLLMGAERLRLFGDVSSTLEAYRLADATLASMDDPLSATLRDTLAQELDALADLPRDPVREARSTLDAIAAALPSLPARGVKAPADDTGEPTSRLLGLLSQLVTVRRLGSDDGAVLDPVMREAHGAALALDLASARAAAERADARAYTAALMRAEQRVALLYDPQSRAVADVRQQIAAAAALDLQPTLPALGATLAELRTLRAARSSQAPARATDLLQ